MMDQIRAAAAGVPGARGVEKCFARKTGLRYHVDLHLEVDPDMTVRQSHEIAHDVRLRILETLDWVADVLVHVEPVALVTFGWHAFGYSSFIARISPADNLRHREIAEPFVIRRDRRAMAPPSVLHFVMHVLIRAHVVVPKLALLRVVRPKTSSSSSDPPAAPRTASPARPC